MKTRDKIILTARGLFNKHRFGNVTLAMIADELGIAKGNLWYHFNEKKDLLAAISEQYLEHYRVRTEIDPDPENILDSYVAFIQSIGEELRHFRFMFRDQADYGEHSLDLLGELPNIYTQTTEQFSAFYVQMRALGHLDISDDQILSLSHNVILILRYNLDFLRERGVAESEGSGAVTETMLQHLSVLEDRLTPDSLAELRHKLSRPLESDRLQAIA